MSLFRARESRSLDASDLPWVAGGSTVLATSIEASLRLIPVYSAISGIADDVGTLPLHAFRDEGNVRRKLEQQPQIVRTPGIGVGPIAWRVQAVASLLTRGNAFGLIVARDAQATATRIVWAHPDRVQVDEQRATPVYLVDGRPVPDGAMVHVPAFVLPGSVVGMSPLTLFRSQLTKGLTAEKYAADFYDRGVMPPGVLRNTARTVSAEAARDFKARFKASVASRDVFVTGSDWEWTALSVPDDDAKFLETIRATATQVAAIYRVAPEDIGGTSGESMTYKTLEMNELRRARRALMPWTERLEEAITYLLPRPQYVKFNLDAIARADLKTRMQAHEIALRAGLETQDEGRALEDRPPLTQAERDQWQENFGGYRARTATGQGGASDE